MDCLATNTVPSNVFVVRHWLATFYPYETPPPKYPVIPWTGLHCPKLQLGDLNCVC